MSELNASVASVTGQLASLDVAPAPSFSDLPDELIVRVVEHLGLHVDTDEVLVDEAVISVALTCRQCRLLLLTQCHWAVVSLRQEAVVERAVGPKPTDRSWRDEWVPMRMERCSLEGKSYAQASI